MTTRRCDSWGARGGAACVVLAAWGLSLACGPREDANVPKGPAPQYEAPPPRQWEPVAPAEEDSLEELIDSAIEEPVEAPPASVADAGAPPVSAPAQ